MIWRKFGKICCKQINKYSTRLVIALAYICINQHSAHSIKWRIHASINTKGVNNQM